MSLYLFLSIATICLSKASECRNRGLATSHYVPITMQSQLPHSLHMPLAVLPLGTHGLYVALLHRVSTCHNSECHHLALVHLHSLDPSMTALLLGLLVPVQP